MLARRFLIPIVLTLSSPSAFGQYGYGHGQGDETTTTQPVLAAARINDEGQLVVRHIFAQSVYETQTRTIAVTKQKPEQRVRKEKKIQDGKEVFVEVPYTVMVPITVNEEIQVSVSKAVPVQKEFTYAQNAQTKEFHAEEGGPAAVFYETNGKKVSAANVAARLTDWQPILTLSEGQTAEDYYTYLFKPGTLIAALPRPTPKPLEYTPSVELPQGTPIPMPQPPPNAPEAPTEEAPKPQAANAAEIESTFSIAFQQDQKQETPTGFPPTFAFAKTTDRKIELRTIREVTRKQAVPNPKAPALSPNGETQNFPVQIELQNVVRTHDIWQMDLDQVEGVTGSGQKLKGRDLPARLPREATVLITKGGRNADAFWLRSVRPETLILSTPIPQESVLQFGHGGGHYHHAPMQSPPQDESDAPKPST